MPLGVILESAPKLLPAGFWRGAEEDVAAFGGFFVDDAERVCVLRHQRAGSEVGFDERARETHDEDGLRRRIAIAALPGRIDAADGPRQAVAWPIEVDGAHFAVIFGQDTEMRARFHGKGIANLRECRDQILPTNFIAQGWIYGVRDAKPCGMNRGNRQPHGLGAYKAYSQGC